MLQSYVLPLYIAGSQLGFNLGKFKNIFRGREIYFTLGIAIYLAWTLTLVSLMGAGIYFGNNCGISVDDEQAQNDYQVIILMITWMLVMDVGDEIC